MSRSPTRRAKLDRKAENILDTTEPLILKTTHDLAATNAGVHQKLFDYLSDNFTGKDYTIYLIQKYNPETHAQIPFESDIDPSEEKYLVVSFAGIEGGQPKFYSRIVDKDTAVILVESALVHGEEFKPSPVDHLRLTETGREHRLERTVRKSARQRASATRREQMLERELDVVESEFPEDVVLEEELREEIGEEEWRRETARKHELAALKRLREEREQTLPEVTLPPLHRPPELPVIRSPRSRSPARTRSTAPLPSRRSVSPRRASPRRRTYGEELPRTSRSPRRRTVYEEEEEY